MKAQRIFVLSLFGLIGCDDELVPIRDGGQSCPTIDGAVMQDLAPSVLKCAAAKGLSGDNLLCIDFSQISSLSDSKLAGWDFSAGATNCTGGWGVNSGLLQVPMFNALNMASCGFTLPSFDTNLSKYNQYGTLTLSVRMKVDLDLGISTPNQLAQVYLGTATPASLVTQISGNQIEQQLTLTVDKQRIPGMSGIYKFLIQESSQTARGTSGLQISSIAIMGTLP